MTRYSSIRPYSPNSKLSSDWFSSVRPSRVHLYIHKKAKFQRFSQQTSCLLSHQIGKQNLQTEYMLASFPGLPHLKLLIASSMQKRRGKAWEIFSHDTQHDRHMSSRLRSTVRVMYQDTVELQETLLHSTTDPSLRQGTRTMTV